MDSGVGIYPGLASTERLVFPGRGRSRRRAGSRGRREGEVAFAVADERGGIRGLDAHRPFLSASLSKAMILVAYLRQRWPRHRADRSPTCRALGYMIRLSDNASADTMYARVGDERLGAGPRRPA